MTSWDPLDRPSMEMQAATAAPRPPRARVAEGEDGEAVPHREDEGDDGRAGALGRAHLLDGDAGGVIVIKPEQPARHARSHLPLHVPHDVEGKDVRAQDGLA